MSEGNKDAEFLESKSELMQTPTATL